MMYSMVMLYYHRPDHLFNTLSTFRYWYCDRRSTYEVVIVEDRDSHENEGYNKQLREVVGAFPDVPVRTVVAEKAGISSMHNQGVQEARYSYVLFNGPETLHARHCLRLYDEHFADHPESYAIGSCQCSEFPGRVVQVDPFALHEQGFHFRDWYQHTNVPNRNRGLHFSSAIRKDVFWSMGGFHPGFDGGCAFEDDDFIEQVRYCGIPVHNLDSAITVHQAHDAVQKGDMAEKTRINAQVLNGRRHARASGTIRRPQ